MRRATSRSVSRFHDLTFCVLLIACVLTVLFDQPYEAAMICAVAALKIGMSRVLAERAQRTLAALPLAATARTPMTRRITRLSQVITLMVFGVSAVMFVTGSLGGPTTLRTVSAALVVGAIPVELLTAVSATFAAGAARMTQRKAVVRRLAAVETIGAATVVCTTRAGPLTQNQLTVTRVVADGRGYETTGTGYSPKGEIRAAGAKVSLGDNVALDACLLAGFACNDSRVIEEDGRWQVVGDPLEAALLASAAKLGLDKALPRVATLPFAPDRRFMATLHRLNSDEPGTVQVKGSVERVLYLCDTQLDANGCRRKLDGDAIRSSTEALQRRGLRVVAFAHAQVAPYVNTLTERTIPRLIFLGLQVIHDPVRPHALDAIRTCQDAGIMVKMITGDDATTARATAAWVGLDGDALMTGAELRACPAGELPDTVNRTAVFARLSPDEKEMLVRALQSRHHIVAITGESDDDLPALRQADISVDIRANSTRCDHIETENTRPLWNSVDLTIIDGDFASIAAAVEEGRGMLDNLAKYLDWALPAALGPGLVLVTATLTGTTLPIQPLQLLWLSMIAVLMLGPPLTAEPPADHLMRRPPPTRTLFGPQRSARILLAMLVFLGGAFGLFHWELAHGTTPAQARTAVVNVLAFTLLTYLLGCRSAGRPSAHRNAGQHLLMAVSVTVLITLQLAYTHVPVLNELFGSAPLGGASWLAVVVVAMSGFVLTEAVKRLPTQLRGVPAAQHS